MCFSAEASFGASAILLTIGIVSIKKSTSVPQKILSCTPLIFGIQQFVEGILWLSLSHPALSQWTGIFTYAFLVFAWIVWPVFMPLSALLLEKERNKKRIFGGLLALGIIVSSYLLYCMLAYKPEAQISCYHIQYDVHYTKYFRHAGIFYFLPTVFSLMISSTKRLRLLGVVMFLSYVATRMFYEHYLISVWCFFAAIISIIVLSVIIKLNKPPVTPAFIN